ncbi:hypothetical protein ABI59_15285 [Acidobacteria bacterium Mor1]|nr:hypothetical protein ABI59_15285 [Acidobacteria bacterium Mor1]
MSDADWEWLVSEAKSGSSEALEELIKRQIPFIRSVAHGRLSREERRVMDTDDVVQDCLVRFLQFLERFEDRGELPLKGFLAQVAKNRLTDHHRVSANRVHELIDSQKHPRGNTPLDEAMMQESLELYLAELNRLSPADRFAVMARLHLDVPYAEIGEQIGLRGDAARMRIHRALDSIRERVSAAAPQSIPRESR